jgi:hypothetical protein
MEGDTLVVDKNQFNKYNVNKPIIKTKWLLNKLACKGFQIESLENKKSGFFTVSYPKTANVLTVLYSYLTNRSGENHFRFFSYRFVENPKDQTRDTFFLAYTDGLPAELREMHYWLYDEAVTFGYEPQGYEDMGCYVYKKGTKVWLLLGSGPSYHEDEFLHSVNYKIAAKCRLHRVFSRYPEKIKDLRRRFPDSFGRPWTQCYQCKTNSNDCKNRVTFKKGKQDYHHCGTNHHLYFHDPDINDLKTINELFKLENNIKNDA